jgi:heavy metal sensor kinase
VTSIRRSLVVYFLALEAIVLGAVSISVYETTQRTLKAKEATNRELLLTQHKDRCHEEQMKLRADLAAQARTLASLAQAMLDFRQTPWQPLQGLAGLYGAGLNPYGYLQLPLWGAETRPNGAIGFQLRGLLIRRTIQFDEDLLHHDGKSPAGQYFQINGVGNTPWRSKTLGDLSLPFDPDEFTKAPLIDYRYDEIVLPAPPADLHLYRVAVKVPVSRSLGRPPPRGPGRGSPPQRSPAERAFTAANAVGLMSSPLGLGPILAASAFYPGRPRPPEWRPPDRPPEPVPLASEAIWVQCACDAQHYEALLGDLNAQKDEDLAYLEAESAATLATLRNRLLAISLGAFAATLLGGCLLVGVGLSPLRRLTDAVSRISPRDFRLEFEEPRLPLELRPIVERLTQTLQMLKRAFAREKQAAADLSHDLRTPVASLLMTTEVALRKPRTIAEYREYLEECHATGQHMNQIVERLLALARLDAQADMLRPQEVDAAGLVEECAALVRPLAEAHGLTLEVHGKGPARLTADRDKLREVVTNLLHNAIEYNRPHGRVEVAVGRENGHLQLEVRDTGIGMAPEVREHIFERFYRADPSRQADGLHAGLGLAIVKSYIDLMGGTIAVESTEGEGSTFRVQLPA